MLFISESQSALCRVVHYHYILQTKYLVNSVQQCCSFHYTNMTAYSVKNIELHMVIGYVVIAIKLRHCSKYNFQESGGNIYQHGFPQQSIVLSQSKIPPQ